MPSKIVTTESLRQLWYTVIGEKTFFSLESRVFHAVSIAGFLAAILNGLIIAIMDMYLWALLMFAVSLVMLLTYYVSRFKRKLYLGIVIIGLGSNLAAGSTYFLSGGSNGVTLLWFILIMFVITVVVPRKQFWIWVPPNFVMVIGLLIAEYYHPEWIKPMYASERNRLIDLGQTMFEVVALFCLIVIYLKTNYKREKSLAKERQEQLEETNEAKNKLFSIVAHDLKAPLASIENYLELLGQISLSPEEKGSIEKDLLRSTRQTSELLQNILSWSKDQMNGVAVHLQQIFVQQTLDNTIRVQQNLASDKCILFVHEIDAELQVIADPNMLQLVIRNLLNNAVKFTPAGGEIKLSCMNDEDQCVLVIQDNGIGINQNEADIFSLKSNGTYGTNNEKGVGLGLSLTKTYVELQGGKLWFESEPGKGTTFYVSLAPSHSTCFA